VVTSDIQQRERDEITEDRAHDDSEKDPGVVRHDAQHQHVAQGHLQHVEDCLDNVQQPAGEKKISHTLKSGKYFIKLHAADSGYSLFLRI